MEDPMCTTYNNGDDAMVCHGSVSYEDLEYMCWSFDGSDILPVANTTFRHDEGALTHWKDAPIVVGGYGFEVETYDGQHWNRDDDFPANSDFSDDGWYIEYHSVVNFKGDVYVFGGYPKLVYEINVFKFNGSWKQIQNLARPRYGHRSVVNGDYIYHIGGHTQLEEYASFEAWKYDSNTDTFTITLSNTTLFNFYAYPETFIVNAADYAHCI